MVRRSEFVFIGDVSQDRNGRGTIIPGSRPQTPKERKKLKEDIEKVIPSPISSRRRRRVAPSPKPEFAPPLAPEPTKAPPLAPEPEFAPPPRRVPTPESEFAPKFKAFEPIAEPFPTRRELGVLEDRRVSAGIGAVTGLKPTGELTDIFKQSGQFLASEFAFKFGDQPPGFLKKGRTEEERKRVTFEIPFRGTVPTVTTGTIIDPRAGIGAELTGRELAQIAFVKRELGRPEEFELQDIAKGISKPIIEEEQKIIGARGKVLQEGIDKGVIRLEDARKGLEEFAEQRQEIAGQRFESEFGLREKVVSTRRKRAEAEVSQFRPTTIDISPLVETGAILGTAALTGGAAPVVFAVSGGTRIFSAGKRGEGAFETGLQIGTGALELGFAGAGIGESARISSLGKIEFGEKASRIKPTKFFKTREVQLDVSPISDDTSAVLLAGARRRRFIGAEFEQEFGGAFTGVTRGGRTTLGGTGAVRTRGLIESTEISFTDVPFFSRALGRPTVKPPKLFTSTKEFFIEPTPIQPFPGKGGQVAIIGRQDSQLFGGLVQKTSKEEFRSLTGRLDKFAINLREPTIKTSVRGTTITGRPLEGADIFKLGKDTRGVALQIERQQAVFGRVRPKITEDKGFKVIKGKRVRRKPFTETFAGEPPIVFQPGDSIGTELVPFKAPKFEASEKAFRQVTKQISRPIAKQDAGILEATGVESARLTEQAVQKSIFTPSSRTIFGVPEVGGRAPTPGGGTFIPLRIKPLETEFAFTPPVLDVSPVQPSRPRGRAVTSPAVTDFVSPAPAFRQPTALLQVPGLKQPQLEKIGFRSIFDEPPITPFVLDIPGVRPRTGFDFGFPGFLPPIPGFGAGAGRQRRVKIERGFFRTPSFAAVQLGIFAEKPGEFEFTGIVERPRIKKKRKKK